MLYSDDQFVYILMQHQCVIIFWNRNVFIWSISVLYSQRASGCIYYNGASVCIV